MQKFGKAMDKIRANEAIRLKADGKEPILKNSRWCFLKRKFNLTKSQKGKLKPDGTWRNDDVFFPDSLIGITPYDEIIDKEYLLISLMTKQRLLNQVATESAQKNINYGNLRPLPIYFPTDVTKQEEIARKIKLSVEIIEQKQTKIYTLKRLKKSLMQNLLTGKIRVNYKLLMVN